MNGIEVKTEVAIDHWELGRTAAGWGSDEQAHFLHGLATGFSDLKGSGPMQVSYIVGGLKGAHLQDVRQFVEMLAEHFKGDAA